MNNAFGKLIADSLSDKLIAVVLNIIPVIFFSAGWLKDPFYQSYWIKEHLVWFLLYAFVFLGAAIVCLWTRGLWVVLIIGAVGAMLFGYLYEESHRLSDTARLATWILHWIVFSLMPGILTGFLLVFWKQIKKTQ